MQCLIDWEGNQENSFAESKVSNSARTQLIANDIQSEVDSRGINYEEANQLGNKFKIEQIS